MELVELKDIRNIRVDGVIRYNEHDVDLYFGYTYPEQDESIYEPIEYHLQNIGRYDGDEKLASNLMRYHESNVKQFYLECDKEAN